MPMQGKHSTCHWLSGLISVAIGIAIDIPSQHWKAAAFLGEVPSGSIARPGGEFTTTFVECR